MTQLSAMRLACLGLALMSIGCERIFGTAENDPERVTDLAVGDLRADGFELRWTQVSDGAKGVASYYVAVDTAPLSWPNAAIEADLVEGTAVGTALIHQIFGLQQGRTYYAQLVAVRLRVDSLPVLGAPSDLLEIETPSSPLEAVSNLSVTSVGPTTVSLSWTQVDDGAGAPANYLLAYGPPVLNWESARPTARSVLGTTASPTRFYTVDGLAPSTSYEFQLATVRGEPSATSDASVRSNLVAATTSAAPVGVAPLFVENFDSGARSSGNGFTWSSSGPRVAVSNNISRSGQYSLAFQYGPDTTGQDSSAEQRFNLGVNAQEVWFEYYLFVPQNWIHRTQAPGNNKFFVAWANSYSTVGDIQIVFEYERQSDSTSEVRVLSMNGGANVNGTKFTHLLGTSMRGQWVRVRIHLKAATTSSSNDGVIRLWRDDSLVYSYSTHALNFSGGNNFFRNGYLLGWSNSGYTEPTTFYVDDFSVYTSNPGW